MILSSKLVILVTKMEKLSQLKNIYYFCRRLNDFNVEKMKNIIYILPFLFFFQLNAQTHSLPPTGSDSWNNKNALTQPVPAHIQKHFDVAIDEIEQMLKGEKTLSFKRAVYLVENAYYEGKVSWEEYNNEILRIKPLLSRMIYNHNLQQRKTAGNWAVFTFMFDSIPENKFKPYQYDIENFMNGTKDCYMVSHLLKAKKGNCRSLPYLYKILANELNAEAFLAVVPMHIYIKHRGEEGSWWNLESTSKIIKMG